MELKCPECGKWMAVSQEELVIHDCQVVCPQCLAVCRYENGALVVRDDSDAPYRHTANAGSSSQDKSKFCHSCGKKLPSGSSFCPYCGADLKAPFTPEQPAPVIEEPKPEPVVQKTEPAVQPKSQQPASVTVQRQPKVTVEDKLRTMPHRYNTMRPHLHQNGTMPSKVFKLVAYAIIAILLILLVCIIIAGNNIEPNI